MMNKKPLTYEDAVEFHGHTCPGLAIGFRMATEALEALAIGVRSGDEEYVAIVENDACGVDAIQLLTGCTFGKGNLIFKDWGKMAFTLIRRDTGRAVRVSLRSDIPRDERAVEHRIQHLLTAPVQDILVRRFVTPELPPKAQRRISIRCSICGETTMDSRIRQSAMGPCCIPCSQNLPE